MKLIYSNFKVANNNGKGFWVSLRELNYMIKEGIISVDADALEKYMDTKIPELSITRMYENYDIVEEMIYQPTDEERSIMERFIAAGEKVRQQMDS